MTRLLLLIPTLSYRTSDFMAAAENMGVEVAVGSNQKQVLEELSGGGTLTVDFRNVEKGVGQITAFNSEYPLSAIVGVDDEGVVLAARAAAALNLPHNRPAAVETTQNKYRLRSALANSGLPAPPFRLVATAEDPGRAAAEAPYPCVLKPLSLAGSRGVIRADNEKEFIDAFHRIAAILKRDDARGPADTQDKILIEGYIPGEEVAVEGLLQNGRLTVLAIFDKPDPLEGPTFEETIYVTPSRLPTRQQQEIAQAAQKTCSDLGLREGPVHAEFRLNDRGVWPLDVAARSIGGMCSRVLNFGLGLSLEDLILRHALGRPVADVKRESQAAGVMMIPTPRAGILRRVEGVKEARAVAGITNVTISIPVGGEVAPPPEGYRYLGFIFAGAESPQAAERALRAAHGKLHISIGD